MQDWDRVVTVFIGGGVAVYTGYAGWRSWQAEQKGAAIGSFLLAVATLLLPFALIALGG